MKLIKEIYDENKNELNELIDYLEMLRKNDVVFKNYEGVEDVSDELDGTFYYEYVEYTLDENLTRRLKPEYNTIRIEIDYILNDFKLARVYFKNLED